MTKKLNNSKTTIRQIVTDKIISRVLIIGGMMGLISSFMLTIDKIHVASDPTFSPNCNLNPVLSCVSVMGSTQSEILGFPNQVIGIIAFSVIISVGVLMYFTKGFEKRLWQLLAIGVGLGFLVINWLIIQSVFVLGALCLWCMFTWAGFAPLAWYSFLYNLERKYIVLPSRIRSWTQFILNNHLSFLLGWYVIVIGTIIIKFWYYWKTII